MSGRVRPTGGWAASVSARVSALCGSTAWPPPVVGDDMFLTEEWLCGWEY